VIFVKKLLLVACALLLFAADSFGADRRIRRPRPVIVVSNPAIVIR
jgi:hypothetical protein